MKTFELKTSGITQSQTIFSKSISGIFSTKRCLEPLGFEECFEPISQVIYSWVYQQMNYELLIFFLLLFLFVMFCFFQVPKHNFKHKIHNFNMQKHHKLEQTHKLYVMAPAPCPKLRSARRFLINRPNSLHLQHLLHILEKM